MTTRKAVKILREEYRRAARNMGIGDGSVSMYVTLRKEKLIALGEALKVLDSITQFGTNPYDYSEVATANQTFNGWMYGWKCSKCEGEMYVGEYSPKYCPKCGREFTVHNEYEE